MNFKCIKLNLFSAENSIETGLKINQILDIIQLK